MRWPARALSTLLALAAATTLSVTAAGAAPVRGALLAAADRQVRFTAAGTTVYGTVHIPAHRAGRRLAAALLLPGSGPTDRDGDQPPAIMPGTLAQLATAFGADGVMTLRFDKYGTGRTGLGAFQQDPGRLDMAAFTRQAAAAYAELREQPEADPHALLIAGHSEGGLRALLLAREVRPAPAGLALLEPQDQHLLDSMDAQLGGQLDQAVAAGQLTAAQARANKAALARVIADFRAGRPVDTSGLLPPVAQLMDAVLGPVNGRYTRTDDAVYPPDVARQLPAGTRVLVTCGTADSNVPCATTPPLLAALTAAGSAGPGLRVLPGLDHLLHPAGSPLNGRPLAPSALRAIHHFLRPWRV